MVEITADSTIYDLLKAKPDATEALFKFGMGPNGMAPGAIRTELGFVNIGMTCSASLTGSLEF